MRLVWSFSGEFEVKGKGRSASAGHGYYLRHGLIVGWTQWRRMMFFLPLSFSLRRPLPPTLILCGLLPCLFLLSVTCWCFLYCTLGSLCLPFSVPDTLFDTHTLLCFPAFPLLCVMCTRNWHKGNEGVLGMAVLSRARVMLSRGSQRECFNDGRY